MLLLLQSVCSSVSMQALDDMCGREKHNQYVSGKVEIRFFEQF